MGVNLRQQIRSTPISFVVTGDNVIVPAVAGKLITVIGLVLSVSAATNLTFKDGASNLLSGAMSLAVGIPLVLPVDPTVDWYSTSSGSTSLIVNQSGTAQVSGTVFYV